jgi:hypothetical protein
MSPSALPFDDLRTMLRTGPGAGLLALAVYQNLIYTISKFKHTMKMLTPAGGGYNDNYY